MSLTKILLLYDGETSALADKIEALSSEGSVTKKSFTEAGIWGHISSQRYDAILTPVTMDQRKDPASRWLKEHQEGLVIGYGIAPDRRGEYDAFLNTLDMMTSNNPGIYLKTFLEPL